MTNEGHGGWTVIILQCESMIHMLGALKSKSQCWVQRNLSKRLLLGGLAVTCLYAYERNIISCLSPKKFPWPQAPSNVLTTPHIFICKCLSSSQLGQHQPKPIQIQWVLIFRRLNKSPGLSNSNGFQYLEDISRLLP